MQPKPNIESLFPDLVPVLYCMMPPLNTAICPGTLVLYAGAGLLKPVYQKQGAKIRLVLKAGKKQEHLSPGAVKPMR